MDWNIILLKFGGVLGLIGLNAAFVSVEFSIVTVRRTRIEQLAAEGKASAAIILKWIETDVGRDALVAACQLGITLASLALGYLGEEAFASFVESILAHFHLLEESGALAHSLPLLLSLTVVTGTHVVLGEQVPKVLAMRSQETILMWAARPMQLFQKLFYPFIWLLDRASALTLQALGMKALLGHSTHYTLQELRQIVKESGSEGVIQQEDGEMVEAIFDLEKTLARQLMVPRPDIVAIEADLTWEEAARFASQYTLTKYPVFRGDLDHILGIFHIKDLVSSLHQATLTTHRVEEMAREALFLPETIPVRELLHAFRQHRQHIAILMDEYGGTSGLITLEDLLEEIVGKVNDVFDPEESPICSVEDGVCLVDGRLSLEELNADLGLNWTTPYAETIAGYVLGALQHIPVEGEQIKIGETLVTIEAMAGRRVAQLRLELPLNQKDKERHADTH